ncbi:MAG: Fic family protein [Mycoplasmatales bacterium]
MDFKDLRSFYDDVDTLTLFNVYYNSNIKKVNKCFNLISPGLFRNHKSITSPNVIIKFEKDDVQYHTLPIGKNNIDKYLKLINNLNLLVNSNNRFVFAWVIHCIFEGIHPFKDGNGRTGRFHLNFTINNNQKEQIFVD